MLFKQKYTTSRNKNISNFKDIIPLLRIQNCIKHQCLEPCIHPFLQVLLSEIKLIGQGRKKFKEICDKYPHLEKMNHLMHLGTLGTGNHFIEMCLDEEDRVWVMLHSGSRGIGNSIGRPIHLNAPQIFINPGTMFPGGTKYPYQATGKCLAMAIRITSAPATFSPSIHR